MKKTIVFSILLIVNIILNAQSLRPPAVPLLTFDPYFSIWSFGDKLNESQTKHWTGKDHSMLGFIRVDGKTYRFMGTSALPGQQPAVQKGLTITATQSIYEFACGPVNLTVSFISPLLIKDIEILSRPVGYIVYTVQSTDNQTHLVQLLTGLTPEICVNRPDQEVLWEKIRSGNLQLLKAGTKQQNILGTQGDDVRIDWGYLYVAGAANAKTKMATTIQPIDKIINNFSASAKADTIIDKRAPRKASDNMVLLAVVQDMGAVRLEVQEKVLVAYDDIYSIQYFGQNLRPWWNRDSKHKIEEQIKTANDEYQRITALCSETDRMIASDAENAGGREYAQLCVLGYRQAIAAHKLVASPGGMPLFLSKENFSNGSIGTVDVTFPSAPLFVTYNTTLLKGMLEPVFYYSESGKWTKPFAAHDVGTYPLANGQTYPEDMPVEECGNMLILSAAITMADKNNDYIIKHWQTLAKWAKYLTEFGLDPGNQLCTDDFAGHLAHNTHLSVKAILALKAYAYMANQMAHKDISGKYHELASKYVKQWMEMAIDSDHYALAFDKPGTWSQKYNLVWDKALGFNIFPPAVFQKELRYYLTKQNKYGLPLDSRETYGKCDWMVWSASIARDNDTYKKLLHPVWLYVNETPDRIPLSDWHWTLDGKSRGFRARSVPGAFWIRVMENKLNKTQ